MVVVVEGDAAAGAGEEDDDDTERKITWSRSSRGDAGAGAALVLSSWVLVASSLVVREAIVNAQAGVLGVLAILVEKRK